MQTDSGTTGGPRMPQIDDVFAYWNSHPLFSHEIDRDGAVSYFDAIDRIKRHDVERFSLGYWQFERFAGKTVLDIGCGPGWLTVQYARAGAAVTAIDLTDTAVDLTRAHLAHFGLTGTVQRMNAETLAFADRSFDLVVSSGVLHHTPDTQQAFREAFRVTKAGGTAKITLYRLGFLHSPLVFPLTRTAMRLLAVKHPGADMSRTASDVRDFVRQYDGAANPIGIAKTNLDWATNLTRAGFVVAAVENHYFPRRFLPWPKLMPGSMHRLLDRRMGTMAYFSLQRRA